MTTDHTTRLLSLARDLADHLTAGDDDAALQVLPALRARIDLIGKDLIGRAIAPPVTEDVLDSLRAHAVTDDLAALAMTADDWAALAASGERAMQQLAEDGARARAWLSEVLHG